MSMVVTWSLGELIAKLRRDAHMDQAQLADTIGVARNTLSNYERDRSVPPFDVMARIARVTGVSLDWLAEMTTAPADSARAVDGVARLEGLEPPTF